MLPDTQQSNTFRSALLDTTAGLCSKQQFFLLYLFPVAKNLSKIRRHLNYDLRSSESQNVKYMHLHACLRTVDEFQCNVLTVCLLVTVLACVTWSQIRQNLHWSSIVVSSDGYVYTRTLISIAMRAEESKEKYLKVIYVLTNRFTRWFTRCRHYSFLFANEAAKDDLFCWWQNQ